MSDLTPSAPAQRVLRVLQNLGGTTTLTNPALAAHAHVCDRDIRRGLLELEAAGEIRREFAPRTGPNAATSGRRIIVVEVTR